MIYNFLVIICIIVPGIYYSLKLSYLNSAIIPFSPHISMRPIFPYAFDFVEETNMNYPGANTCASLFTNSDGNILFNGSV